MGTNENQLTIGRLNSLKVKRLVDGLISPSLFFIKRIYDEEQSNILGNGVQSSNKKGGENHHLAKTVPRQRKIKENHMVLMLNLAKKVIEDGELTLAEVILNTQVSMQAISEDLMQMNQHKLKGFSKDFIQRYLSGIAEFIKAD